MLYALKKRKKLNNTFLCNKKNNKGFKFKLSFVKTNAILKKMGKGGRLGETR